MVCQRSAATALTAAAFLTGLPLNAWAEEAQNSTMAARSLRGSNGRHLQIVCSFQNEPCSSNGQQQCCGGLECQASGLLDGPDMVCQERPHYPPPAPPPVCLRINAPCSTNGRQRCCAGLECAASGLLDGPDMVCQERPYYPPPAPSPYSPAPYPSPYSPAPYPSPYSPAPYPSPYSPAPYPSPYSPAPYPAPWRPPASSFGSSFEVRWAGQRNTCMDVAGGRDENFDKIQVWACDYPENQNFYFERVQSYTGRGRIRWAKDPSKCLDVKYGKTDVVIYSCHPDNSPFLDNQVFDVDAFAPHGNGGSTYIRWKGKCVDLYHGIVGSHHGRGSHSHIIVYDCHARRASDAVNQQWNVEYGV